jgi:hypothetical protein
MFRNYFRALMQPDFETDWQKFENGNPKHAAYVALEFRENWASSPLSIAD